MNTPTKRYQVGGYKGRVFDTMQEAVNYEKEQRAKDGIFRAVEYYRKRSKAWLKLNGYQEATREHNNLRLLCASNALKPYLEADLNSHEPWSKEIDEFLSAIDALQV